MRDISSLLKRWGGWAAGEQQRGDYAPIAAGFRGLLVHTPQRTLRCTDHDGQLIDRCISQLKHFSPGQHQLIVVHYLYRVSLRAIARRQRLADGTVRKEIHAAEGFIAGVLSGQAATLECENNPAE